MEKYKSYQEGYEAGRNDMQEAFKSEKYLSESDVKKLVNNWKEVDKNSNETIKLLLARPTYITINDKPFAWLDDNDLRNVYKEWCKDGIASDKDLTHFALMIQTALVKKNEINK